MALDRLISADSHTVEPPDLWEKRIDAKFRDRAPRVVQQGDYHHWYVDMDISLGSVGAPSQAGKRYENLEQLTIEASVEDVPAAAYDPTERLKALEKDGVIGEVVYATMAARLYTVPVEGELLSACFRAINDWTYDFCSAYPKTIKGAGLLNLEDMEEGIRELKRCAQRGMVAAVIPTYPGDDRQYELPEYEPFWATVQDLGLPLSMHAGTERPGPGRVSIAEFATNQAVRGDTAFRTTYDYWARRSVASMIFGGAFERYPGVKVAVVEHDVGWVPHFLRRMDMTYKEHGYVKEIRFKNGRLPSEVFRSNVLVTFQEDPIGVALRSWVGVENMMWGSDFPHRESTWPRSRQVLSQVLDGVPEEEQRKIAFENAARVYGFDVN